MTVDRPRLWMLVLLAALLIVTLACTVTPLATETGTPSAQVLPSPTTAPTITEAPTAAPTATATRAATATAAATTTTPATPAGTPTPLVIESLEDLGDASPAPGQRITIAISEEALNDAFTLEGLAVEGATLGDPAITLEEGAIVARMDVAVTNPQLSLDVILRGVPNVVEGDLFLAVDEVTLGESTDFFTRLIAQPMVDSAIREYSGEDGIPLPIPSLAEVEILEANVAPGMLTIEGQAE